MSFSPCRCRWLNIWPPCGFIFSLWNLHFFNCVIRLRKVEQLAFFQGFTRRCRCVETAGRCDWPHFLFLSPRQVRSLGVVLFLLMCFWWGSIVHVIQGLNTDSRRWGWNENRGPLSLITNTACHCGCIIVWTVDFRFLTWQLKSLAAAGRVCGNIWIDVKLP